jgi:hypothetical protein
MGGDRELVTDVLGSPAGVADRAGYRQTGCRQRHRPCDPYQLVRRPAGTTATQLRLGYGNLNQLNDGGARGRGDLHC